MAKPRIKLKSARATAPGQRGLDRALHLLAELAEAVGMTPSQVMRNPHAAKAKWKLKEAEGKQAKAKLATELAPLLNMTTEQFIRAPMEEIERRLEEFKQERANAAVAELDRPNLRYATPLDRCRQHQVELYSRGGRRFARLFGEDRAALQARADRWREHISPSLEQRWPES